MSDGFVYLGGGTPTQHAAGRRRRRREHARLPDGGVRPGSRPGQDRRATASARLEHHDWLVARGVEFLGTVRPDANGTSAVDGEGLLFTGGENAYPFDELAAPAQRGHVVQGGRPGGAVLMRMLSRGRDRRRRPHRPTTREPSGSWSTTAGCAG